MKPIQHSNTSHSTAGQSAGFWDRLGRIFRRSESQRQPALVKVWDASRGNFREVNLHDRDDPLWFAAQSLAGMQDDLSRRSAA